MSALKTPIDYKRLEEELYAALAADELYKLQNDAKIRAIEQGVPTYEHFRQMVNGAHLKPLDRDDTKPKVRVQWNPIINSTTATATSHSSIAILKKPKLHKEENIMKESPETSEEFVQFWIRIADYSEKFVYVWNLRNILQTHIFRVEIPAAFLSNFMDVCLQHLSKTDDISPIVELLNILSKCNRFDLAICFMTKDEQSTCEQLLQQLRIKGNSQNKASQTIIDSLAAKYRTKLN